MNPKNKQAPTFGQQLDFLSQRIINTPSREEVKDVLDTFISFFKELKKEIGDKIAENKAEMSTETARFGKQVAEFEARIREIVGQTDTKNRADLDALVQELRADIGYVADWIERYKAYDDSVLFQSIAGLSARLDKIKIPREFNPSELKKGIEQNKKDIADLKKRTIKGAGGVSDMRIAQAFKYILKTEEPVGDIDGVNLTYTLSQPIFAILSMSLNGEVIAQLPNYTINGKTFTFTSALPSAYSGKDWEVKYI